MEDDPLGRAGVVEHPQHVVVRVAVVDDQRLAVPLAPSRCARGRTPPAPRPSGPVRKWSSPVSPTARTSLRRRPARRSRPARRRARPAVGRAAAPRWGAARLRPRSRRALAAVSTAQRAPGRSQPICTIRGTPTAAAGPVRPRPTASRPAVGDVEVAVAVGDRDRQRLGRRRLGAASRAAGPVGPSPPSTGPRAAGPTLTTSTLGRGSSSRGKSGSHLGHGRSPGSCPHVPASCDPLRR